MLTIMFLNIHKTSQHKKGKNMSIALLESDQRTIKGWRTAVDQLISSNGFGTTP
jgi:hypothetical protein